jgi:hypothetical protein
MALRPIVNTRASRLLELRLIFQAWQILALLARSANLQQQLQQAQEQKKPTSIWTMKKADLQELARQELGLRLDQSARLTVIELRELLRQNRATTRLVQDPRFQLPKGLSRMTAAQLQAECEFREIALPSRPNRAQMMMAIREYVIQNGGTVGQDWLMADSAEL